MALLGGSVLGNQDKGYVAQLTWSSETEEEIRHTILNYNSRQMEKYVKSGKKSNSNREVKIISHSVSNRHLREMMAFGIEIGFEEWVGLQQVKSKG